MQQNPFCSRFLPIERDVPAWLGPIQMQSGASVVGAIAEISSGWIVILADLPKAAAAWFRAYGIEDIGNDRFQFVIPRSHQGCSCSSDIVRLIANRLSAAELAGAFANLPARRECRSQHAEVG